MILYINLPPVIKTLQASGFIYQYLLEKIADQIFLIGTSFQFMLLCFHFNSLLSPTIPEVKFTCSLHLQFNRVVMVIQQLIKLAILYAIKFNSIGVRDRHWICEYMRKMINVGIHQDCYRCRLIPVGWFR
jgi:hypothetical protein